MARSLLSSKYVIEVTNTIAPINSRYKSYQRTLPFYPKLKCNSSIKDRLKAIHTTKNHNGIYVRFDNPLGGELCMCHRF